MYTRVAFEAWHVDLLSQAGGWAEVGLPEFDPRLAKWLEAENSWTLLANNVPALCGGTMKQWDGRHIAWAYLNRKSGKHMLATTRGARWIVEQPRGRVEATVRADFAAGNRWLEMLGFTVETPILKNYGPQGEDHIGYVRFN